MSAQNIFFHLLIPFNHLLLLSLTQSTENRQEVEHPDLSIQPIQSRIPSLPTVPWPGAQMTAPYHYFTHLHLYTLGPKTLREWVLLGICICCCFKVKTSVFYRLQVRKFLESCCFIVFIYILTTRPLTVISFFWGWVGG